MHHSLGTNKILFQFKKPLVLGFLFCSFVTFSAAGQGERIKSHEDNPAEFETITDHVGQDFLNSEKNNAETTAGKVTIKKENKEQLNKHRVGKNAKKEGMSTLSFNLFLYVVDRFKEDN